MDDLNVRIARLEPIHVAIAHGFGESPEGFAWDKILAFAKAKKLDLKTARFFGYNNPDPSPGSPHYGYDQWITVSPAVEPEGDIRIKDFSGGLYAITSCKGVQNIFATWQRLVTWREKSPYQAASHQWLEECLTPPGTPLDDMVLDLYLPISE